MFGRDGSDRLSGIVPHVGGALGVVLSAYLLQKCMSKNSGVCRLFIGTNSALLRWVNRESKAEFFW